MARELAAVLERDLNPLDVGDPPQVAAAAGAPTLEVELEAPDLCPRYLGWRIGGIKVGPSPDWLRSRLESVGQRPINNIVDLTNYILMECGQPLHTFDSRQIAQDKIVVRRSRPGEKVTTLDGTERELPENCCVIADPERAVAIAGIMGLANSEVQDDTTEIILEVANFEMVRIRANAKHLGLRTESSVRFEKGIDVEGVPAAAHRFFKLLRDLCPDSKPMGIVCDVRSEPVTPEPIQLTAKWVSRRLGTEIPESRSIGILQRLAFAVEAQDGQLTVTPPSWRAGNIKIPEDVLEEIGRIHGYDNIEPVPLRGDLVPVDIEPERAARARVRELLSGAQGLTEIYTYPFTTKVECERLGIDPGDLALKNAEQPGLDLMTPSLLPALVKALCENRKYRDDVGLYVTAPVFTRSEKEGGLPSQPERLAIGLAASEGHDLLPELKGSVEALLELFRLRGVKVQQASEERPAPAWLHPGRAAALARGRDVLGWFGQLHPRVMTALDLEGDAAVADLDLERLRSLPSGSEKMTPISRFPVVPYDVAVVVDRKTPADLVEGTLRKVDRDLVRDVSLFDVYEGPNVPDGKRSLAYRIVFGAIDRTLDTEQADALRKKTNAALEKRGWSVRSG